jgi:hypothetical protein
VWNEGRLEDFSVAVAHAPVRVEALGQTHWFPRKFDGTSKRRSCRFLTEQTIAAPLARVRFVRTATIPTGTNQFFRVLLFEVEDILCAIESLRKYDFLPFIVLREARFTALIRIL